MAIKVGERLIASEEVVSRMSEIASEDDDSRRQLVDLAACAAASICMRSGGCTGLEGKQGGHARACGDRPGAVRHHEEEELRGRDTAKAGRTRDGRSS